MQLLRSLLESVVIVVAHVEVDLHALEFRDRIGLRIVKNVVALEVGAIEGTAEYIAHHGARRAWASGSEVWGNFSDERRHLRAHGCELLGKAGPTESPTAT